MIIISSEEIKNLKISPGKCVDWVREAFLIKDRCQLPPKVSLHPQGIDFFNTMPCLLPPEYQVFGCKIVSRIAGNHPALKSEIMVFDTKTGELTALLNGDWITAMRTGAVAALAINTLRRPASSIYSIMGLGVIGHATIDCLLATNSDTNMTIRLLRYKDHAERTIERYHESYPHVKFEIADGVERLIENADVVVSCVTEAKDLLVEDTKLFKPGVLVVPVHTRGFQNCDLIFDKVFADDEGHVKGFKYFNQFRHFSELAAVLKGQYVGRDNKDERILSYNVGIGIHDVYFAYKIIQNIDCKGVTPPPHTPPALPRKPYILATPPKDQIYHLRRHSIHHDNPIHNRFVLNYLRLILRPIIEPWLPLTLDKAKCIINSKYHLLQIENCSQERA